MEKGLMLTYKAHAHVHVEYRSGNGARWRHYGAADERITGGKTKLDCQKYWMPIPEAPQN